MQEPAWAPFPGNWSGALLRQTAPGFRRKCISCFRKKRRNAHRGSRFSFPLRARKRRCFFCVQRITQTVWRMSCARLSRVTAYWPGTAGFPPGYSSKPSRKTALPYTPEGRKLSAGTGPGMPVHSALQQEIRFCCIVRERGFPRRIWKIRKKTGRFLAARMPSADRIREKTRQPVCRGFCRPVGYPPAHPLPPFTGLYG